MIITISGPPGSGKNTIAEMLAKRLGFRHYSIGDFRGRKALEKGMTLEEYNKLGEKDPSTDFEADEYQKELAKNEDNLVIDSRLGFYFIPKSVKIYLDVSVEEGAKRVFRDSRPDEKEYKTLKEAIDAAKKRIRSDRKRYKKYYNIDCYDKSHYDLVIDTTMLRPNQILQRVLGYLKNRCLVRK